MTILTAGKLEQRVRELEKRGENMRLDEAKRYDNPAALVKVLRAEGLQTALGWLGDAAAYLQAQELLGELRQSIPAAEARLTALQADQAETAAVLQDAVGRAAGAQTAGVMAARAHTAGLMAGTADNETYSAALQDTQDAGHVRDDARGALSMAGGRTREAERDLRRLQDQADALGAMTYDGPPAILAILKKR